MDSQEMLRKFNKNLSVWEMDLQNYSEEQLRQQPAAESWSIGQVYAHLTEGTLRFHLKQVNNCLSSLAGQGKSKTFPGRMAYWLGQFPPIRIKVPASPEYTPVQPAGITQIRERLDVLKEEMTKTATRLQSVRESGKTKHPAFGYLDAREWYQLIDMHFRHHLRQKKRLDQFLKQNA